MKGYRTYKTTMGRKIRVRMSEEEIAEREIYHMVITVIPFLASVLITALLFGRG